MYDEFLVPYGSVFPKDESEVGMKGYRLAKCSASGFRIPQGFILPVNIFRRHLQGDHLNLIYSSITARFKDTRKLIIRSSCLQEDQEKISYAGRYLSKICNNDINDIEEACDACWASYDYSTREENYVVAGDKKQSAIGGMALIVQRLLNASSAGVCFTADPLDRREGSIVINAVHGLGEAITNGEVVSDHYEYNLSKDLAISRITGRQKFWKTWNNPELLQPVPERLLGNRVLSDTQIYEVGNMAKKAEELFKAPVDIEWAYEGDRLYLLQVRPITTLGKKEEMTLWTRDNVADVIPDPVTPLTWAIVGEVTNDSFNNVVTTLGLPWDPTVLFRTFDGRIYFNRTAYERISGIGEELKGSPRLLFGVLFRYVLAVSRLRRKVTNIDKSFRDKLKIISAGDTASAIVALKTYLNTCMRVHFQITILMDIGFAVIRKIAARYLPLEDVSRVIDSLVTGLKSIESTQLTYSLYELAGLIAKNKELKKAIESSSDRDVPGALRNYGENYSIMWERLLEQYGYSSLKEFELYFPRWADDPTFFVTTLRQYLEEREKLIPLKDLSNRIQVRTKAEETILGSAPWSIRPALKYFVKHVQHCSIWRESVKQKLVRIIAEVRKHAIEFASRYSIVPTENVFFLTLDEMVHFEKSAIQGELMVQLIERKEIWERQCAQESFREICEYAHGRQVKVPYFSEETGDMRGMPLSSGTYVGPATLMLDPNDSDCFKKGDVLVTHSVNPSWTPLFGLAGAIVVDMGNYLSHGAIIARELGIPAVGNVFSATKGIRTGDTLYVDGDKGIVRKI